jgi:hypothetical protein
MNTKHVSLQHPFFSFAVLVILAGAILSSAWGQTDTKSRSVVDVRGTWSGTFFSKHNNVAPFTMTVVITPDASGRLVGNSSLSSNCLKDVLLHVTVSGSQVVLSGSDDSGNNVTVRGTLDTTGAMLKTSYILNGSASGKCETDNGTGNLAKR